MKRYSKEFREDALKPSDEIGVKNAAKQRGNSRTGEAYAGTSRP